MLMISNLKSEWFSSVAKRPPFWVAIGCVAALHSAYAAEAFDLRTVPGYGGADITAPLEPGTYLQIPVYAYHGKVKMPAQTHLLGNQQIFQGSLSGLAATFPNAQASTPVTSDIHVDAKAIAPRWIYMTNKELWGATLGVTAMVKLISKSSDVRSIVGATTISGVDEATLNAETSGTVNTGMLASSVNSGKSAQAQRAASELSTSTWGMGDLEIGAIMRWAFEQDQILFSPGLVLPTGKYNKNVETSPGSGDFYSLRLGLQYGHIGDGWDVGVRGCLTANGRNSETGYRTGSYINIDSAAMKSLNDSLRVGIAAYGMFQTTRDTSTQPAHGLNALTVNRKGHVYGIGPDLAWIKGADDALFEFKLVREFSAEFRPEGTALWMTASFQLN